MEKNNNNKRKKVADAQPSPGSGRVIPLDYNGTIDLVSTLAARRASSANRVFVSKDEVLKLRKAKTLSQVNVQHLIGRLIDNTFAGTRDAATTQRNLTRLAQIMKGESSLGGRTVLSEFEYERGGFSYRRLLYDCDMATFERTICLPVGDISNLTSSQAEKLSLYAQFVADRYAAIPDLDPVGVVDDAISFARRYSSSLDISSLNSNAGVGNGVSDDGQIDDVDHNEGQDVYLDAERALVEREKITRELAEASRDAKRRFLVMNIIQPLLRDALVVRSEAPAPSSIDVIRMAFEYADWLRMQNQSVEPTALQNLITRATIENKAVAGLINLRQATMYGVPQNAVMALNNVGIALQDEGAGIGAYVKSEDETTLSLGTSFASVRRSCVLKNLQNEPRVLQDSFVSHVPDIDDADSFSRGLIKVIAHLQGMKIADSISTEFLTSNPAWSGLLSDSTVGRSGDIVNDPDVVLVMQYARDRTKFSFFSELLSQSAIPTSRVTLSSTENDATYMEDPKFILNMFALAHSSLLKVCSEALSALSSSREFSGLAIWDELRRLQLLTTPSPTSINIGRTYVTYSDASAVTQVQGTGVEITKYYVSKDFAPISDKDIKLREVLRDMNALGDLTLTPVVHRDVLLPNLPYASLDDFMSLQSTHPEIFSDCIIGLKAVTVDQIINHPQATFGDFIIPALPNTSVDDSTSQELQSDTMVFVVEVPARIYVKYTGLAPVEGLSYDLTDDVFSDILGDANLPYDVTVNGSLAERFSFRSADANMFIRIRSVSRGLPNFDPRFVLPTPKGNINTYLRTWEHDVKTNRQVADDVMYDDDAN